ncbi:deoxyribonuclease-1-like protein, partial [Paragonimus westermani]
MIVTENSLTLGSINLEIRNQTETDKSTVVKYLSRIISEVDLCLVYGFVWRPRLTPGLFLDELNSNETEYKYVDDPRNSDAVAFYRPGTVTVEVSKPSELDGVLSTHEGCPFRCYVTPKQPGLPEFLLTTVKMNYSEAVNDLNEVCLMLQCLQRKFQNIVLIGDFGHVCRRNFASEEYNWLHSEQFIWVPDNQINASDTSGTTVHNQIVCFGDLLKEAFQKEQSTTVDISKLLNISPSEVLPIILHPPVRIELKWHVSIDS